MTNLRLDNVTKTYGRTRALDSVTCEIPGGRVHGLIGRNGAGKTTLLRALAGQVPTDGSVAVDGEPVRDNQPVLDRIILAGADVPYPGQMTVGTLLDIAAARWATWDHDYARHLQEIFAVDRKPRFDSLSRGQKTLVGVVMGLATRTGITLLDEPYLGLDVQNREQLYRELLEETGCAADTGRTFIISTHQVEDAALILDSVILMDDGQVTSVTGVDELTEATVAVAGTSGGVTELLDRVPCTVLREETAAGSRRVVVDAGHHGADLLQAADGLDVRVRAADLQETVLVRSGIHG